MRIKWLLSQARWHKKRQGRWHREQESYYAVEARKEILHQTIRKNFVKLRSTIEGNNQFLRLWKQ